MVRFLIWFVFLFGGAALGIFLDLRWFPQLWHSLWFHGATLVAGLLLLRLVMVISRNTGRYLARHGREGEVPRMETNRLVTGGMYGCMRHPMHLGLMLFPWAFALITGSVSFLILIAPAETLLILLLIRLVEEPQARKKFGKAYDEYMQKVPMFSFRKECLKLLLKNSL